MALWVTVAHEELAELYKFGVGTFSRCQLWPTLHLDEETIERALLRLLLRCLGGVCFHFELIQNYNL